WEILHRLAGLEPACNGVPWMRSGADRENKRALGQILRVGIADGGPDRSANIAVEPHREVGVNWKTPEFQFGFHLPVAEGIVPAAGEERIDPHGGAEERKLGREVMVGFAGWIGNGRIGAFAREIEPFDGVL